MMVLTTVQFPRFVLIMKGRILVHVYQDFLQMAMAVNYQDVQLELSHKMATFVMSVL